MKAMKERWAELTPKQKRMAVVLPALGLVMILIVALARFDPADAVQRGTRVQQEAVDVFGRRDSRSMSLADLQAQMNQLRKENADLRSTVDRIGREGGQSAGAGSRTQVIPEPARSSPVPQGNAEQYLGEDAAAVEAAPRPSTRPPPGVTSSAPSSGPGGMSGPGRPGAGGPSARDPNAAVQERERRAPPIRRSGSPAGTAMVLADDGPDAAPADAGAQSVADAGQATGVFIPAGAIFTGVLLTGVDAPTGRGVSGDPIPVLARIKEQAILPNRFQADVRECFVLASVIGDLSSERAYLRGEAVSCVRRDGGVIETRLGMYGVGEDGKAGVRGRLVSKQAQVIARALIAGFAEGMARAFQPQRIPQLSTSGDGSGFQNFDSSQAAQAGAFGGMSSALDRLSQFYIRMAESMFPVIEVDADREISFVVTQGGELLLLDP